MAIEFSMLVLLYTLLSVLPTCVISTFCQKLFPCTCKSEPKIKIDCSGISIGDLDFTPFVGLEMNELVFRQIHDEQLPSVISSDLKISRIDISDTNFNNIAQLLQTLDKSLLQLRMDNAGVNMHTLQYISRFENLTLLSIKRNNLDLNRLPEDVFSNLHRLKTLDLSFNSFFTTSVKINVFKEMNSLEVLHLKDTNIDFKYIENLYFLKDMKNLKELILDKNSNKKDQTPIQIGPMFENLGLESLKRLSLRFNNIIRLNFEAFYGIESLEVLDLSNNLLPAVPEAVYKVLLNISELNLENNGIPNLVDKQFENFTSLKTLNLRGNKLETLPHCSFKSLGNTLRTLDLSSNELRSGIFWVAALRPLISLTNLNISFNHLKYVQNDSFEYLVKLRVLDISGNPLIFTDTMFNGIEWSLKELYLRNVGLTRVPSVPLGTLMVLDILDLSDNEFHFIGDYAFKGLKVLNVFLKNMKISQIMSKAFAKSMYQLSVYLDNNNISSIDFLKQSPSCLFGTISLNRNPLVCDCDILMSSASGRLGSIKGICSNDRFNRIKLSDTNLESKLCPNFRIEPGRCTKTGRFISNSATGPYQSFHKLLNQILLFICGIFCFTTLSVQ